MKNKRIINKKGYTLVELVMAVALLAIIASMAVIGISYLSDITESVMHNTNIQHQADLTNAILDKNLKYANRIEFYKINNDSNTKIDDLIRKWITRENNNTALYFSKEDSAIYVYKFAGKADEMENGVYKTAVKIVDKVDGIEDIKVKIDTIRVDDSTKGNVVLLTDMYLKNDADYKNKSDENGSDNTKKRYPDRTKFITLYNIGNIGIKDAISPDGNGIDGIMLTNEVSTDDLDFDSFNSDANNNNSGNNTYVSLMDTVVVIY